MQQIDGTAESSVAMSNNEWQQVLIILRKAPYEVVAPLIDKIISQCVNQAVHHAIPTRTTQ